MGDPLVWNGGLIGDSAMVWDTKMLAAALERGLNEPFFKKYIQFDDPEGEVEDIMAYKNSIWTQAVGNL